MAEPLLVVIIAILLLVVRHQHRKIRELRKSLKKATTRLLS